MTMTQYGWTILVQARLKPKAFLLQCSSTESKLSGHRRVWLTVWHRPAQASAFVCGEGFFGARRWWSQSRPRGDVMTMMSGYSDDAFLFNGVCVFLLGLPSLPVCHVFCEHLTVLRSVFR